jgi:glycosyltransferase involved in cell wall biosynthesis
MRILLISHPPLAAELGAAQVALHLAAALSARGHEALARSPEPLPPDTRGWNLWLRQRRAIAEIAAAEGPFDVIDTPAITASRRLARHGRIVVRSVQPELRYLFLGIRDDLAHRVTPRALVNAALGVPRATAILAGWRRAASILCQGSAELAWMRRRFPGWSGKLGLFVCALPPAERAALAAVRRQRPVSTEPGTRFLWIGRWSAQKGTSRLLRWLRERLAGHPADSCTLAGCGPAAAASVPTEWLRSGQVRIVPAFSRSELPSLLAAHTAGLFTSDVEGWGLSLNEMLESGMPVFATEAGGVVDLRPFFPGRLLPFPPPARGTLALSPPPDLDANGYSEHFSWDRIAEEYERQALAPAEGRR